MDIERDYEAMGLTMDEFKQAMIACIRFVQSELKLNPGAASNVLLEAALLVVAGHVSDDNLEETINEIQERFPPILRSYQVSLRASRTTH